ncbi:MAG: hypothetical protein ACW99U_20890 [Candidatus Thorarchaeota archaeon]
MGYPEYTKKYSGKAKDVVRDIERLIENSPIRPSKWEKHRRRLGDECQRAIKIDPNCYPAYFYLGIIEHMSGNNEGMLECFLKGLEVADEPYNWYTWAESITMLTETPNLNHSMMIRYLTAFYKKDPRFSVLRHLVRDLWKKQNRRDEALFFLSDYLQKNPEDRRALRLRKKIEKSMR